jgi:hypothetical protein
MQPMQMPAQDAGGATKPKQNTNSHGRQATCTMVKQEVHFYQSAGAATHQLVPPMATTSDEHSSPLAVGD